MATLSIKNGRGIIQWRAGRGRRTLHLGAIDRKSAEQVRGHVDALLAVGWMPLSRATAAWVEALPDDEHAKLAKLGLVKAREAREVHRLADWFDAWLKSRSDLKPRTIANFKQAKKNLVTHFGADRDISTITPADALAWQQSARKALARATVARDTKRARQVFDAAVAKEIIAANPFKALKVGSQDNPARLVYVSAETVRAVIDKCPDAEWRLIFALARWGGVRTPSESHLLRWEDILWDRNRMRVRSPKTEHHEGKAERIVPILPELLPYLRDAIEQAAEGATLVIHKHRGDNLRTHALRIVGRAGVKKWPRLFQNLRASCETDLCAKFPIHVVCEWIGNSALVAKRHYLSVTEADFEKAVALQNALHATPDLTQKTLKNSEQQNAQTLVNAQDSSFSVPPPGGEHTRDSREILQAGRSALQNALHGATKAERTLQNEVLPNLRRDDVTRLGRKVRAARRRGGRGRQ